MGGFTHSNGYGSNSSFLVPKTLPRAHKPCWTWPPFLSTKAAAFSGMVVFRPFRSGGLLGGNCTWGPVSSCWAASSQEPKRQLPQRPPILASREGWKGNSVQEQG